MKPKAIISLLWGRHLNVLKQFLMKHSPMTVLTHADANKSQIQSMVADTGSTTVFFDDLFEQAGGLSAVANEAAVILSQLNHQLQTYATEVASSEYRTDLSAVISKTFAANLPFTLKLLNCLAAALRQFDIVLLVTNEDVTSFGKIATTWSKAHGIPSLLLSHSIALADPYTVHNEICADKIAVYGKRGMEGYLDLGYPENKMVATGNPDWDCYTKMRCNKPQIREYLNQKYGFNPQQPLVVFGTTYSANLSAHSNEEIFSDTVIAFLAACETLKQNGIHFNPVIKDHPSNIAFGQKRLTEIFVDLGLSPDVYWYCPGDGHEFAAAANVLIGVDSNYLVEGMLAKTAVINLLNASGMLLGPSFEAETGVIEAEWHELADAIEQLLTNTELHASVVSMGESRSTYYNHGDGDGMATVRVTELMTQMTTTASGHSDVPFEQAQRESDGGNSVSTFSTASAAELIAMYTNDPRTILHIGSTTDGMVTRITQRFPDSHTRVIECGSTTSSNNGAKLDGRWPPKLATIDLRAEGIDFGTLDAVMVSDAVEDTFDIKNMISQLHPYMSNNGQIIISAGNIRNVALIDSLSKGHWIHGNKGHTKVSNDRLCTRQDIQMLGQATGYRLIQANPTLDPRLAHLWQQRQDLAGPFDIDLERLTLKTVTRQELLELCTLRFYFLFQKDRLN